MSQCFVQLICRLNTASTEVHNMVVVNSNGSISIKNVEMIRNCNISGDKCGSLENITRVNVLQSNLMEMTKSTSEKFCQINTLYQPRDYQEGMLLSPFVEMHKEGSDVSVYRDVYLRIPLSQLFSLGSLTALDTSKTGTLRIHVELENLSYLTVIESALFKNPLSLLQSAMENIGTTETSNLITTLPYVSLDQSPFFVGQKLSLTYAGAVPPAPQGEDVFITAISRDPVSSILTLTTTGTFVSLTDITVIETLEVLPVTLQVATANLGICEVMGGSMPGDVLEYTTFTSEQYSNNARTLDKVFEVEASAINAMLMFNDNTSNMISHQDKVESYRMRIDQSDVYDRDIFVNYNDTGVLTHDPLHYDSINRTMLNTGLPLKNLTFLNMVRDKTTIFQSRTRNDLTLPERFDNKDLAQLILACPLVMTPMSKKLQFTVNTKDANDFIINGVILFKQVVRSVKLSK
jgi:hypothetical protein